MPLSPFFTSLIQVVFSSIRLIFLFVGVIVMRFNESLFYLIHLVVQRFFMKCHLLLQPVI